MTTPRPDWDDYFMRLVDVVADRSTCTRARVGCVLVDYDRTIVATGYVGSSPGLVHCTDVGCDVIRVADDDGIVHLHCVRTAHAEANAIAQAAKRGTSLVGSTAYASMEPCLTCARLLVAAGVKRVVVSRRYHAAERSRALFAASGVALDVVEAPQAPSEPLDEVGATSDPRTSDETVECAGCGEEWSIDDVNWFCEDCLEKVRQHGRAEAVSTLERRDWTPVTERLPESGVPVIAYVPARGVGGRRIRAEYAAPKTLELSPECEPDEHSYDEETDTYWCAEGWYESNEYEETHWRVDDPVTHWTQLPAGPTED